jgi:soluble lytic murein transglycosylase-like protein
LTDSRTSQLTAGGVDADRSDLGNSPLMVDLYNTMVYGSSMCGILRFILSWPGPHVVRLGNKKPLRKAVCSLFLAALFFLVFGVSPLPAQQALLIKIISDKNLRDLQKSLAGGSYRGEEGILSVKPEVGRSLGVKVYVNQDYQDSVDLFKQAETSLEKAKAAMASKEKESFPGEHVKNIASQMLAYRAAVDSAQQKLVSYRLKLTPVVDERLNEAVSGEVMARLLTQSLNRTNYQLRDALGYFYNVCRGISENDFPLTPENVMFVNEVFYQFVNESSAEGLLFLNLDRQQDYKVNGSNSPWRNAIHGREFPYVAALEETLEKFNTDPDEVDPLLFISLMKRESGFDPLAVSPAGAAGLTQIMPETAALLGMKNVFNPSYLAEANSVSRLERITRARATATLFQINGENSLRMAAQARELMQEALALGQKKDALYSQYKKDLLQNSHDDRLNPSQAIEHGFAYFVKLMGEYRGDISLALAAYNAGSHRVREYKGIPPFPETVNFRNKVLEFYAEYLRKLGIPDQSL